MQHEPTYSIQRRILAHSELSTAARLVGLVLALAADSTTGKARLRRDTITARTRVSGGQLRRCLRELVEAGIIGRQATGRATVYTFPFCGGVDSREGRRVDGPPGDHQAVPEGTISSPFRDHLPELEQAKARGEHG